MIGDVGGGRCCVARTCVGVRSKVEVAGPLAVAACMMTEERPSPPLQGDSCVQ